VSHLDPERLALNALGEPLSQEQTAHLQECDRCSRELEALRAVADLGRDPDAAPLLTPPAHIWTAIDAATTTTALQDIARPSPPVTAVAASRRTGWLVAAGIGGILAGAAGVLGWQSVGGGTDSTTVATATLEPLPEYDGTGEARVVDTGTLRELVIDLDVDADPDGFYEVWLLRPDVSGMVSLGVLSGGSGSFALPDDLDLGDFAVVDVSAEPYDGQPTHSGDSIVRGELADA
jgi:hypothetical protein